jgi:hypothetical protein
MPSEVSICNRALAAVNSRAPISSLTERSEPARQCNLIYADTRDEVLQMAQWNFAQKTAILALLKSAPGTPGNAASTATEWSPSFPAPPWLFEYAYPTDCLQVRTVIQQQPNVYVGVPLTSEGTPGIYPYAIGPGAFFETATDTIGDAQQNVILTNEYKAIARYTTRITSPQLFGAMFTEALVNALAAKLAIPLTGQKSLANLRFGMANQIISQARADDANEGLTVIDNIPDWIAVRDEGFYSSSNGLAGYVAPFAPLYGTV